MERGRILVFDVGTSAVKTVLFSASLAQLAASSTEYPLITNGARVEAAPESYLAAMREGVSALGAPSGIDALCLTTQGETLLPVDAAGEALANAIVWLDARAEHEAARLSRELPAQRFYETTGLPSLSAATPLAKLAWLAANAPAVFSRAAQFLLLEDWLRLQCTGVCASHASLQTSTGYFDIRKNAYWPEALALAGIPAGKLPPLLPSGAECGALTERAARLLGLTPGIPVYTGAMDQTSALLAASAGQREVFCETTGTAHVVAAAVKEPRFSPDCRITLYRHALENEFLCLPIGNTAGMAYQWFRREFGKAGEDYAALDALAAGVPAGAEGVLFLPYLCGAADPEPAPDATACFFGMRLSSTRGHAARAVLEATGYELKEFLALLSARGSSPKRVAALGGGAQSPLWLQMRADISGCALAVPLVTEAAAAGAALLACWGAGMLPRGTYPPALTESRAVYAPDPAKRGVYEAAFARRCALRTALMPLYRA